MISLVLVLAAWPMAAQTLQGVVDLHAHAAPDSTPRSIDYLNLVRLAKKHGYRGLVLKNHYEPTASWAATARQEVPGIEVFGGIALNRTVGGVNAAAVERMTRVDGGWGKVVWMPTYDSEHHVKGGGEKRPYVSVSKNGNLLPEVLEVLDLIAKHKLVLATGHSSPAEVLLLIGEARRRGVASVIVTHPFNKQVGMKVEQLKQAVRMGAMVEFVANGVLGNLKESEFSQYAGWMKAAGFEAAVLTSDFGQKGNPLHPDGMLQVFEGLKRAGVTAAQLEMMAKRNPARLMGLEGK
ncbi:MAG: hypothetical protein JNK87_17070 [Bryobacterales bacterium]|nr:hypothetical protein [Bryobacterales bacterium]